MNSTSHQSISIRLAVLALAMTLAGGAARAQSSSFTYQGHLTDGGTAANGNYDLQFALWDSLSGGTQVGSTLTLNTVAVSNGVFSVTLDFGANSFPGANRFLEISARTIGAGSFTLLTPRQQVTSTPYAVRSTSAGNADSATNATTATTATNATQLGGVAASQYVQTGDSRLSDARPPTAGSGNYIQNTANAQSGTNFNISGNGTAGGTLSGNVVNATTQFNIGGSRVLSISGAGSDGTGSTTNSNTFAGIGAGSANAPNTNGDGNRNTFFGNNAGNGNTTGLGNSSFGFRAGKSNTLSCCNSFFGDSSGVSTTQSGNSFFGFAAGNHNTNGQDNSFFGDVAGNNNSLGLRNSFFGSQAGNENTIGNDNTLLGARTDLGSTNLTNATAIGANAFVTQSNSLVLGSIAGTNGAAANTNVGVGTTAPQARLHVAGDVRVDGNVTLFSLGTATSTQATLCRNTSSQIAFCNSSSLRYKRNITPFIGGLDIVNRLRPINFTWKQDGVRDIGFGAEEVEKVAPLFTFKNDKGEIEGVRYDRLGVIFVNAFQEQQARIEKQQEQINKDQAQIRQQHSTLIEQRGELEALKKLVCRSHRRANVCK